LGHESLTPSTASLRVALSQKEAKLGVKKPFMFERQQIPNSPLMGQW